MVKIFYIKTVTENQQEYIFHHFIHKNIKVLNLTRFFTSLQIVSLKCITYKINELYNSCFLIFCSCYVTL